MAEQLWTDERIAEMSHRGNEWITIADAMREEYEAKIAELTAELAAAKAEIATLAGLALDDTNIFSYSTPPEAHEGA